MSCDSVDTTTACYFHRLIAALATLFLLTLAPPVTADETEQLIRDRLNESRPDLPVDSVSESEIDGLYVVQFRDGPRVYASADGGHFVVGDLFEVDADGFVNLSERERDKQRLAQVETVGEEDMIIFPAEGETRSRLYIFTDVDCGYCARIHEEVPELNRQGIEVRYLAYPRAGVGSITYRKMTAAWCADSPAEARTALTELKERKRLPARDCENAMAEQFELARRVGVSGTPALVTPTGRLIPGYRPAEQLVELLLDDD